MAIYTVMRLFCYAVNGTLFPDIEFGHLMEILRGGMRFDLTAILYLSSIYLILMLLPLPVSSRENMDFQERQVGLFHIPNIMGIIANCIDIIYIRFTDRRTTCTFFREFQHENDLWRVVGHSLIDYWYVVLFGLAMITLLVTCTRRVYSPMKRPENKKLYYIRETVIFLLSIYFTVIGIRGGFGKYTRPITISNAAQYTNTPRETALVLNTPFSLMKSIESEHYVEKHYFPQDELPQHMSPIHSPNTGPMKTDNVVVIILESFSTEYIGFYNRDRAGYTGYTPFLDSLLSQSVTFDYTYASGRKSIDGMPSVLSSIPMLIEPYIVTPYSTNSISSLAERLNGKGYVTAFFHGAPNGSMGFQAYARAAAFQQYFGMDEYDHRADFDGTWAIWDEPFMQYFAHTMSTLHEPFMTALFTASSHHPFRVPDEYEEVFPEGTHPIHETIGYTDYALRRFFETARQQPWYDHTLFVFTGDHTNALSFPEYTNSRGLYQVPVAFFHPQMEPALRAEVASQTDIMPSILDYLGYDEPYFAFGENILTAQKTHPYAVCYNEPLFQIFSDSLLLQFDEEKVVNVYDYHADRCLRHNITDSIDPERIAPMEDYLKAYIQQYVHRMIHDELTVKPAK
jgi:phosphoglycerol transferase MdoB-like AlkP superfamily enzyme